MYVAFFFGHRVDLEISPSLLGFFLSLYRVRLAYPFLSEGMVCAKASQRPAFIALKQGVFPSSQYLEGCSLEGGSFGQCRNCW